MCKWEIWKKIHRTPSNTTLSKHETNILINKTEIDRQEPTKSVDDSVFPSDLDDSPEGS